MLNYYIPVPKQGNHPNIKMLPFTLYNKKFRDTFLIGFPTLRDVIRDITYSQMEVSTNDGRVVAIGQCLNNMTALWEMIRYSFLDTCKYVFDEDQEHRMECDKNYSKLIDIGYIAGYQYPHNQTYHFDVLTKLLMYIGVHERGRLLSEYDNYQSDGSLKLKKRDIPFSHHPFVL